MHVIAAAASTESYGAWAYLAVFALMVLSFLTWAVKVPR